MDHHLKCQEGELMSTIHLEWFEMYMGANVGIGRTIESMRNQLNDRKWGKDTDRRWELDIQAAMSEMAAAKALDIYWSGSINNFDATYCLIIRKHILRRPFSTIISCHIFEC